MKLQLPGIAYEQGGRQMVATAMSPIVLVKVVAEPDHWNPIGSQPHGNRPQDKGHRKAIAKYLTDEEHFVLNSIVLYAKPGDARFVPDNKDDDAEEQRSGTLYLDYGATFDVGDGQHRIGAYSDVMREHIEDGDPVMERLRKAGQPVVIVIDDNPLHRAQDFTDLQKNVKMPAASMALSMDRRQPINRLLIRLVQDPGLPIFDEDAERVEFLKDSPGKLSAKLFSFKTIRYASGTVLTGSAFRSTASWDNGVNSLVEGEETDTEAIMREFWNGIGNLPAYADVIKGTTTVADLRERTYLASAAVLYAIAYAVHFAHYEHKIAVTDAMSKLAAINFERPATGGALTTADTILAGSLVDPETGTIAAGRSAWESAGEAILKKVGAHP